MKVFKKKQVYNTCRGCNNPNLFKFFSVKSLPMPEGHIVEYEEEYAQDLDVFFCKACFLVQTQEDLDLDAYYKDYIYTPGNSAYANEFMKITADKLIERGYVKQNSHILEIGSGDGTQLLHFVNKGIAVTGVEPSTPLVKMSNSAGVNTIEAMFNDELAESLTSKNQRFDAVLIQYTFDHLTQPVSFLKQVRNLLTKEGVLLIEVHDFEKILDRNEACLFTHEHSIYPSKDSLTKLLESYGLMVLEYDFIHEKASRGNSMIVVAARNDSSWEKSELQLSERLLQMRNPKTYETFAQNIIVAHERLRKYLKDAILEGKKIAGYGAAGRGVDTCVIAGVNAELLTCIYDKNPSFQNKLTPVSRIPVKEPKALYHDNPDELIVFSYGYLNEIKEYYSKFDGKIKSMLDIISN